MSWTFVLLVDFGECLCTRLDLRPVQVVNKPALMDLHQVFIMVLK